MNRLILALIISCGLTACSNNGTKKSASTDVEQTQPQKQKDRVEVLYFHSKQRCATCMAIEKNAKEAVEAEFADELKNGTLVFRTIDISEPKNEAIAEKYEVTWSSLFISKWKRLYCTESTSFAFGRFWSFSIERKSNIYWN